MQVPTASHPTDVHSKALAINLEQSIYGTFAEIGAGQEVARWFLSVGAASGTVAQTISAYDKTVSDDTYGAGTRYVSKERLLAMLDHEYGLLVTRLAPTRGAQIRFFVFADTVSARNYQGTNEQHGWIGIRFQCEPGSEASQILLHINLADSTAQLQQEAIGLLGVNLIYAAHLQRSSANEFLRSLFDELSISRIEIDALELSGPTFAGTDSRSWCLDLLRLGMSHAIVFDSKTQVVEPSSALRKRPLIVLRGTWGNSGLFTEEVLEASTRQLLAEGVQREPAVVLELTIHSAWSAKESAASEMLAHVEQLCSLGTVMVTDYVEAYEVVHYLRRHTTEPLRLIAGISLLVNIMQERFYQTLPGTLLEGIGKLLAMNVTIYIAPMAVEPFLTALGGLPEGFLLTPPPSGLVTVDDVIPKPPIDHLYKYLRAAGRIVPLAV
jgi:hypothetical protein